MRAITAVDRLSTGRPRLVAASSTCDWSRCQHPQAAQMSARAVCRQHSISRSGEGWRAYFQGSIFRLQGISRALGLTKPGGGSQACVLLNEATQHASTQYPSIGCRRAARQAPSSRWPPSLPPRPEFSRASLSGSLRRSPAQTWRASYPSPADKPQLTIYTCTVCGRLPSGCSLPAGAPTKLPEPNECKIVGTRIAAAQVWRRLAPDRCARS